MQLTYTAEMSCSDIKEECMSDITNLFNPQVSILC